MKLLILLALPVFLLAQTGASSLNTKNPLYSHATSQSIETKLESIHLVTDWGPKYDGLSAALSATAGSAIITKASGDPNPFTAADVGKLIEVPGAGATSDPLRLSAVSIGGVVSTSTLTPVSGTLINAQGAIGVADAYVIFGMFCQGTLAQAVTWQVQGSPDGTTWTAVYTATVQPIVANVIASLNNRDTYRVFSPTYQFYRVAVQDAISGTHASGLYIGNVHSHILSGYISSVTDATHVVIPTAATNSITNTGISIVSGEYGTDNFTTIQNAIHDVCGWNGTSCSYPSELIFPNPPTPPAACCRLGYLLKGSLNLDYVSLIGRHTQLTWAQSTVPSTVSYMGVPATSPLGGPQPYLIQAGQGPGDTSFETWLEGFSLNANGVPSTVYVTATTEEDSGTRGVSVANFNGELGGRMYLVIGTGAQNSYYFGGNNTDLLGSMIPPPPLYTMQAITPNASAQTVLVNRTDWYPGTPYIVWQHTSDAASVQITPIDANCTLVTSPSGCRVSGIFNTAAHAVNDAIMLQNQPIGMDLVNVSSKVVVDNETFIISAIPGWSTGLRNYYSNVHATNLHFESESDGIQNYGTGSVDTVTGLSNVNVLVSSFSGGYSQFEARNLNAGAPPSSFVCFDAFSKQAISSYNLGECQFNSTGNYHFGSANGGASGFDNFYNSLIVSQAFGTQIARIALGGQVLTGTTTPVPLTYGNTPGLGWGGCGGGSCGLWTQSGNNGGIVDHLYSYDFGVTFPSSALTMDAGASDLIPQTHLSLFACADGSSAFYPHNAGRPIPVCEIGNHYSAGYFAIQQTASSGAELDIMGCNNAGGACALTSAGAFANPSAWTKFAAMNALSGTATFLGAAAAPGSGLYNLPLYYTSSGWAGYSIPSLLNFLGNSTGFCVGCALGWDGTELHNLTGLNLMTTLAGGASFPATSPLKWTGSAINPMSTTDLGSGFMGLGSSSTPQMMVYQGNTGAFTVQTIPTATTPANSTNIPYYNYGWLSYTPTSFLTNFLGVSVPSSEQMLTTNGAAYFTRPILPTPTTSTAPQIWNGSYWAGATPAQMTTALLGATPANNAVMRYQTSTGTLIGATAPSFTASVPTSHSTPGTPGSFASDSTSLYYWLTNTLVMRINASGNSITW